MITSESQSDIEEKINEAIPIYTRKKPHPVKMRADCPLEVRYKQGLRKQATKKIEDFPDSVEQVLQEYRDKASKL